ncbi:MAG: FAD-dependent oxidoreductase [Thermoprotei archaeon]
MKDRRIYTHPILDFKRGKEITIFFEGRPIRAFEGESLAAAIYGAGVDVFRLSPSLKRPRAVFCMVGKCGSCIVRVNGIPARSCVTPAEENMRVERISDLPEASKYEKRLINEELETDVLIVGGGPAGMASAEVLCGTDLNVVLADDQIRLGGQLIKQTHIFFGSKELFAGKRGFEIAEEYASKLSKCPNLRVLSRTTVIGVFKEGIVAVSDDATYLIKPKYVVVAAGAYENHLVFENNDLPGVMGAGGAQTLMNVWGVKPGNEVLVVGSGNVGLIISYQLLQAGAEVKAVIEALPRIGGWFVHAAKIRRYGVPILTSHTILGVNGAERVEEAIVAQVDEKWNVVEGTEKSFKVDTVLLAVGLTPNTDLVRQFGVAMKYIPELGGLVPLRTQYMETSVENVFIAGDLAAIEEATTAFIEGWIAGYSILIKTYGEKEEYLTKRENLLKMLHEYRSAPVSEKVRKSWNLSLLTGGVAK